MRVAGLDGTKGGWAAIVLEEGLFAGDALLPLASDFAELGDVEAIGIDVPIGFGPDRAADKAARAFLRGAASTVFSTPARELLERPYGPGLPLSAQAHALGGRIIHVTELAFADPRIREVHPEVSFRAMNGGRPLRGRKRSAAGGLERIELLRREGIDLTEVEAVAAVPLDDVFDAAAVAWTATRVAKGEAQTLPEEPPVVDGRPMAIWY